MNQNVVNSLNIEGLFDFGVRRSEQMYQNECRDEEVEGPRRDRHGVSLQIKNSESSSIQKLRSRDERWNVCG